MASAPPADDPQAVEDDVRVRYYQEHTAMVKQALDEGLPLEGLLCLDFAGQLRVGRGLQGRLIAEFVNCVSLLSYYSAGTLLDNFEWAGGYKDA